MFGRKKLFARIEALEAQVRRLENMHATIIPSSSSHKPSFLKLNSFEIGKFKHRDRLGYYNNRQLSGCELDFLPEHPQPERINYNRITNVPSHTAETDRVSKVTLEELARLVVDGTPIKREEKISAKRISEYTEDTTTTITVTE